MDWTKPAQSEWKSARPNVYQGNVHQAPRDDKEALSPEGTGVVDIQLPARLQDRTRIRLLGKERIQTNCYKIEFGNSITIYQYEVKFFIEGRAYGKKNLSEGVKADVLMERRKALLWKLFLQMCQCNRDLFTDPLKFVYDCGYTMISAEEIPLQEAIKTIDLDANLLGEKYRSDLPRSIDKIYVEIMFVQKLQIDSSHLPIDSLEDRDRSSLQRLELIYNQKIISSEKFHLYPQTSYLKDPLEDGYLPGPSSDDRNHDNMRNNGGHRDPLAGRVLKNGIVKSVRVCGNDSSKIGLMLLANVTKSAFFPEQSLLEYLLAHFDCRDVRDLAGRVRSNELKSELKKITLVTTHLHKNRLFVCDGVDDPPADNRTFTIDSRDENGVVEKRRTVSVVEYFEDRYKVKIKCRALPCVFKFTRDQNGDKTKNFYPIDVLKIVAGQRVPLRKMGSHFQEDMIKQARMEPATLTETISGVMKQGFLTRTNPHARKFNVPLESEPIVAEGETFVSPAIKFAQNVVEPERDGRLKWQINDRHKFIKSGECDRWLVVNYGDPRCNDTIENFLKRFVHALTIHGTKISSQQYKLISERRFDDLADYAIRDGYKFVLVITKDKKDPVHDQLKHFEISSGIVTQHLWVQTVNNVVNRNQNRTLDNIIMKTNEKLGGVNFTAVSSQAFNNSNPTLRNVLEKEWIGNNRMFIGVSLSHSGPSGANKSTSVSVVGLSYTCDGLLSPSGHYFYQEKNKTIIDRLGQEIENPILKFKSRSKCWPSHIFIYRSGVSDGEFLYVTSREKRSIVECFDRLSTRFPDFVRPGFTLITCQRNNGFRLIAADGSGNVNPGTFVSKDLVHPVLEQFILVAHRGIQGTSRPITYTVLVDESPSGKRIKTDELKYITFTLCHLHNNVLGTVRFPSVLYHAGALAKRGQSNLGLDMKYGNGLNEQMTDYIDNLSERLRTTIDTKFWA